MHETTVKMIIEYVEELAGHPLRDDEGIHWPPASEPRDRTIERVVVCWMATVDALRHAGETYAALVITHESLFYPYGALPKPGEKQAWEDWPTNRERRECIEQYGLTVLRVHGSLDEICIFDDFAALLGLGKPVEADGLMKVYEISACRLDELVEKVKERIGLPAVRVSAPKGLRQTVRRVGLPWGGLGLFVNVGYQQQLVGKRCDVFIAGESDNYGARFSAELGIPLIETDHEVSENPGLRHFTQMLGERFPELNVSFFECRRVWQVL